MAHRALMAPVGCSSWRHCLNAFDMSAFSLSTPYGIISKSLKIVYIVIEEVVSIFFKPCITPDVLGALCTVKKASKFPVPTRDGNNQNLPGQEQPNYSRPGRVWLLTSRLGTGNSIPFLQCAHSRGFKGTIAGGCKCKTLKGTRMILHTTQKKSS